MYETKTTGIDPRILRLKPKRIYCPLCGNWHDWDGNALKSYDFYEPYEYECNGSTVSIYVESDTIYIQSSSFCDAINNDISIKVELCNLDYDLTAPIIKIPFTLTSDEIICSDECDSCGLSESEICNFVKIGDNRNDDEDEYKLNGEFIFEFANRYFYKYAEEGRNEMRKQQQVELERQQKAAKAQEKLNKENKKEATPMATTPITAIENTTLKNWFLDTTPRQKGQQAMAIVNKHKDVLKWTLPLAAIYAAYKILDDPNSGITVENADEIFEETFGEKSDFLSNKAKMRKLVKRGSAIALGYAGVKLASNFTKPSSTTTIEDLEASIDEGVRKISNSEKVIKSLAPNASDIVPAAISVIILFAMVNPMKLTFLDNAKYKLSSLPKFITNGLEDAVEWGKDILVEHFNIDIESPEFKKNSKKILVLSVIAAVAVFVYGKNMLSKKATAKAEKVDSKLKGFMDYLMNLFKKIAPSAFAAVTTVLLASKLTDIKPSGKKDDIIDGEATDIEDEEDFFEEEAAAVNQEKEPEDAYEEDPE